MKNDVHLVSIRSETTKSFKKVKIFDLFANKVLKPSQRFDSVFSFCLLSVNSRMEDRNATKEDFIDFSVLRRSSVIRVMNLRPPC